MKERLQGLIVGVLIGATITGGVVFATTGTKTIEVLYNNIKVYKDNVLCELKDADGTVIEPFIYNGTTYMPVRGTANLAGMDVSWDGATQSVYLWDEFSGDETFLMDVCPPYQGYHLKEYPASQGDFFTMGGKKYSNGFAITHTQDGFALINLDGKYSSMELDLGYIPRSYSGSYDEYSVSFIVDGKTVKTYELDGYAMPQRVTIPLNYGLQLKVCTSDNLDCGTGFANITLK